MAKPTKSVPLVTFILWEVFMRFHEVWLVLSVMISLETEQFYLCSNSYIMS